MPLDRTVVSDGLLDELDRFEELLRSVDDAGWDRPSRCEGWTVGDVARHVVGSIADVAAGQVEGLGSPEVTAREVAERQDRSAAEVADECASVRTAAAGLLPLFDDDAWSGPAPGGYEGTLGDGVEALWYDTWLHADDIRSVLGRPIALGPGVAGAVSHVALELAKRGWSGKVPSAEDPDAAVPWILAATGRAPLQPGLLDIYAA